MLNTIEAILNKDGKLVFSEKVEWKNSVRVLVTFIDSEKKNEIPSKGKFQFNKARNILGKYSLNLSDSIVLERRS